MNQRINNAEREVNQFRLKIYEETKNLTPEQYTERVRKIGESAARKYGFQHVANARRKIISEGYQGENHV